jgi:hypothetical protein
MALELTPLATETLPPTVARAVGPNAPAPAKMMAARGLAPMGPADMVTAMYQLSLDADEAVAQAAVQTASKLPDNILAAALKEALDARVLHYFSEKVLEKQPLVEAILLNQLTHDETFVALAGKLEERDLELLAGNQQRLLRHPAIIEALYFNPAARASTVDRVLELAVRNGIDLPAIPQFKELAALIMGGGGGQAAVDDTSDAADADASDDALFAELMREDDSEEAETPAENAQQKEQQEDVRNIGQLPIAQKVRLATLGKAEHRAVLVRDSNKIVAKAAITSPKLTDREVIAYAGNRSICEEVIRYIAERREWQKNYQVKVSLVNNPKCPLTHSMRLLTQLRANDLKLVARSKSIPSALAKAAKRMAR